MRSRVHGNGDGFVMAEKKGKTAFSKVPDTTKINETDTFGEEGDDDGVEFGGESDIDDI